MPEERRPRTSTNQKLLHPLLLLQVVAVLLLLVQFPRTEGILSLMDGPERKRVRELLGQ